MDFVILGGKKKNTTAVIAKISTRKVRESIGSTAICVCVFLIIAVLSLNPSQEAMVVAVTMGTNCRPNYLKSISTAERKHLLMMRYEDCSHM